jgi:hypothetical protein
LTALSLAVGWVRRHHIDLMICRATHLRHLYAKLGAHHRSEAVERACALGLLAPPARKG